MTPRRIADDIALCLVFFTRLPLPGFDFRGRTLAAGDLGSAAGRRRGRGGGEHRACAGERGRPVAGGGGGAGARHGDADDRLPARGRAVGRGGRVWRRQDARAKARDHARQPHRRLRRVGASDVGADPLERDHAARQHVLGVLRARTQRMQPRAHCCLLSCISCRPRGRTGWPRARARWRRTPPMSRWRSARWRCWRSACRDWSLRRSLLPSSSSVSAHSACARSAGRRAIHWARCNRLGEIAVLLVAATVLT